MLFPPEPTEAEEPALGPELTPPSMSSTSRSASAATPTPASTSAPVTLPNGHVDTFEPPAAAPTAINGKEPQLFMSPGQSFSFSLQIPSHHYRDEDTELPPSCQVFQVGLQAGVEYVLRIKLARKGWRLNEA